MSTILTITGSDSTGGSGVQADIRAITELGGRVVSVITSLTIQNTLGIQEFFDIPASTVANQIEAIANDTQPDIVKIGMVRRLDTLSVIVNFLQRYKPAYVLYDPVVFSSNGDLLMESHLIGMIRRQLLPLCRSRHATLIIDDDVELALAVGADGVHLGQHDMPVQEAREFLGHGFIIGGTANTLDDVRRLHRASADYIGAGPFRFTTTKEGLAPVLGLEGYAQLVAGMEAEHIRLPLCAIGGITLADIPALLATGVKGVAVSGAVLRADNPADMMRRMLAADE